MDGELQKLLEDARAGRRLRDSAYTNIVAQLRSTASPVAEASVLELAKSNQWGELNDRFYKTLAFGTGGLRGRTIGKIATTAERGNSKAPDPPEFPCVGTNAMNFENVSRATRGLVAYLHGWLRGEKPKLVIAYDSRHFSRAFADLTAKTAAENGCDAFVFEGPRSTPELSFAVRYLNASAGVVITASHNPPHDNGYKVYFSDGAQVVEPHASAIIARVNASENNTSPNNTVGSEVKLIGKELDEAYMQRLETLVLDSQLVRSQRNLRIVYSPIHGTGGVILEPMLKRLGFLFDVVKEQEPFDGNFPTVKSPNPENAEALRLAVDLAKKNNADLVIATDPDCDRMGVAVRTDAGEMQLLTGNQIGSLMACYRAKKLFELGVLNEKNAGRAAIIKTFVTTDLQKAIALHYGLRCVETLTGFKYIGAKLGKYEAATHADKYRQLSERETRDLRLQNSSYYVFGGEESYGYSGADFVRDKDGNGAAIIFCEVAAYAKSQGLTLSDLLDKVYSTFGYFEEKNGAMTFEGAEGAETIKRLLASYVTSPPKVILDSKVVKVINFETETIRDVEGDEIPKEKMLIFELQDKTRIAVRGSGTEPKIKYYMFAQRSVPATPWTAVELQRVKDETTARLDALWDWIQADATGRVAA